MFNIKILEKIIIKKIFVYYANKIGTSNHLVKLHTYSS
jgi:hypothetical protein